MEIFFIVVILLVYFIPSWVASGKPQGTSVFLLNLLLGWTFIGWVVALVWGSVDDKKPVEAAPSQDLATQLERLNNLRLSGALTDQEFRDQKEMLLKKK